MMTEMILVQRAVFKVFGDFVSKVVSDGVDILKSAIKDADLDRKSYNQNLQTRLYQLLVDALNRFTHDAYMKQDKLYDAAESILTGYISTKDNLDAVKSGLKMLVSDVNNYTCHEFLETLCGEICRDDNSDLYKEIDMLWKKRESEYIHGEFERNNQNHEETHKKLNYVIDGIDNINEKMDRIEKHETKNYKISIINRAEEYAQKWDKNVFLNDFNKRDKNTGVNIKLRQLYLDKHLPHYIWGANDNEQSDIEELLREHTVDNDDKKMLLILGQPGIGKSTLITWIMSNFIEKRGDIHVYQFASDLTDIDWQGDNVLENIFETLNLKDSELENKVLILDGFDEIHISSGRERILNQIYHKLYEMRDLKKISLIITCRKNYISELQRVGCDYITLQAWNEEQISSFCESYGNVSKKVIPQNTINHLISNKEILGIPLILYMVLALDIFIGEENSLGDIYDQIFSLNGGIYDRCINNMSYAEEHRISKAKEKIHQISQRIAFWMFENEPNKAIISNDKYEEICDNVIAEANDDIKSDVLISGYFEQINHCEGIGTDELQFMHRSIYEYFVAVYFYESIHKLKSKDKVAGKLGELLKDGCLSEQILEFIKYKFDSMKGYNLADITKEVFDIMIKDGMTFYMGVPCKNAIERELNIFANMLKVVHLWNYKLGKVDYNIETYLKHVLLNGLNLSGVDLSGADLSGVNFYRTDLSGADLKGVLCFKAYFGEANLVEADLSKSFLFKADLNRANMRGANLKGADIKGADIKGADLDGADLRETLFSEEQVNILHEKYDLRGSRVFLSETDEIVSYQEFCIRKQKG